MRNLSLKFQKLLKSKYEGCQINDPLDLVVIDILEALRLGRLSEGGDVMDKKVKAVLDSYDPKKITIGTICSHSALQIFLRRQTGGI